MTTQPIVNPELRSVLMTTDTIGGVWNYSIELARGLSASDITVSLATMGQPLSLEQRVEASAVPGLRIYESHYRLEWMADPWSDVYESGKWLQRLERELRPDIIHLNGYAHGAAAFRAPCLVVAHSCVLSWWEAVKGEASPDSWSEYARHVRCGLEGADRVVAPTFAMQKVLEGHYGAERKIRVIPNGRDPALFRSDKKEPFIFAAGRLGDEAKNIRALASVADALPWPIRVAGAHADPSGNVELPANVQHCGRLTSDEVADQMAAASIYCLPARYEPFGLSILEAALSQCALVLGDIPSLRENWDGAALFVAPNDTATLRDTLLQLIHDPDLRQSYARAANDRAFRFSSDEMIGNYLSLYGDLLRTCALRHLVTS